MPFIHRIAVRTPFGDAACTHAALVAGVGRGGRLDGDLFHHLVELGKEVAAGLNPDLVLLASTKGDVEAWCAAVLEDPPHYAGGLGDLARRLGAAFGCPALAIAAACASGPAALGEAARGILAGGCRRVLVVGGDSLGQFIPAGFTGLKALDPSGLCRPFDERRQGLILGETAAALLLTREHEAGLGVCLSGWGAAMDAHHLTGPCRDGAGLAAACRQALERAGTMPQAIIGHGTGTRYNDESEAQAYRSVVSQVPVVGWKGVLGHSLGPSGLTEAALAAWIVARQAGLPGTAHCERVGTSAPITVLGPGAHAGPWNCLLSPNAGFGGLDAAVVVGRAAPRPLQPVLPVRRGAARLHPEGWILDGQAGRWEQSDIVAGCWPRLTARTVTGSADASWGRMDDACRSMVALARLLGPWPEATAVILGTECGCAATDRAFERGRRDNRPDPQLFPYTLSSAPIGEASIRCRLKGPGLAVHGASEAQLREHAAWLLAEGWEQVLVACIDCDRSPWTAWAERWSR